MICGESQGAAIKDFKRQQEGFLIASVLLDPKVCSMTATACALFNKSLLNPIMQQIQQVVNQNEVFSDNFIVAMKCLKAILVLVYRGYDQKTHQATLTILHAII